MRQKLAAFKSVETSISDVEGLLDVNFKVAVMKFFNDSNDIFFCYIISADVRKLVITKN